MNSPTKKCLNCDKEISAKKMVLHERYCKENIVKCSICHEAVQKEEIEEHNEENHVKTACDQCGKLIEKSLQSTHRLKCSKQLLQCEYCQLSLEKDELHDHEYICGSKTEECCLCHEMVPKMEYDLHIQFKCIGTVVDCSKEETIDALLLDSVIKKGIKVSDEGNKEYGKRNKQNRDESRKVLAQNKKRKEVKTNQRNNAKRKK